MIQGFVALSGGTRHDLEALDCFRLADEIFEGMGPKHGLSLAIERVFECVRIEVGSSMGGFAHRVGVVRSL